MRTCTCKGILSVDVTFIMINIESVIELFMGVFSGENPPKDAAMGTAYFFSHNEQQELSFDPWLPESVYCLVL